MFVEQLPIPHVTKGLELKVSKIVSQILRNENTPELEVHLDELVFELYKLSSDQRDIILQSTKSFSEV